MKKNIAVASANKKAMLLLMLGIAMVSLFLIFNPIVSHASGSNGTTIKVQTNEKTLTDYNALYNRHFNILEQDKTVILSMYDISHHLLWRGEVKPSSTSCPMYYVGPDVKYITLKSKKGTAKVKYLFSR